MYQYVMLVASSLGKPPPRVPPHTTLLLPPPLLQWVCNLRSAVCKNALLALQDLWAGLGTVMDAQLPVVAPVLLKRGASDTQGFLTEVRPKGAEMALKR